MAKDTGKKLADMLYGDNPERAAFGVFPQMKPRRSRQDPEAAKNFPVDLARGVVAGAVGMPGDIESLVRLPYELITGNESPTFLPTSEDVLKRIPFGSDTPAGSFASGLGTLAGGSANVGTVPRAVKKGALAAGRAGERMAERVVPQIMERGGVGADILRDMAQGSRSQIFIGPKAKTWHQGKADMAVALEEAGRTPQEIWLATGTFRGPDNMWRQEISDRPSVHVGPEGIKAKLKASEAKQEELRQQVRESLSSGKKQPDLFPKEATAARQKARKDIETEQAHQDRYGGLGYRPELGNLSRYAYEHPALYEAYPDLASYTVTQGRPSKGELGYYVDREIGISDLGLKKDPRSTMAHEMQHAIQDIEGTNKGGNTESIVRSLVFERQRILDKIRDYNEAMMRTSGTPEYEQAMALRDQATQELIKSGLQDTANLGSMAYKKYENLGGEAEARAVQRRLDMTNEERAQEFPLNSYDVNPKKVEVKLAEGGPVQFTDDLDTMALELAGGGLVKKAAKALSKAAESAGMKAPVTAGKELTTLQDTHTALGDRIRIEADLAKKQMEGFDYQYDKGQRVFTKDSAGKNKPPYTILQRTRVGNQVVRGDHPEFGPGMGKPIIDPETGKAMRTPYEPGYRVRMERSPEDWSEFEVPQSAIIGDVEMAAGGLVKLAKAAKPAKAVKPAKELALPPVLPRAPAKTREEIRPYAQRMAQQMTGEFYRPNPKKSENVAGKSFSQFKMEKGLEHDIRPTREVAEPEVADIEKQLGMLKIGISGDTTIADKVLHRAGPYELFDPSPQHGGPRYGLGGEGAWASNNPIAATVQKRINELSQAYGAPPLGQYMAMGPQGSNFAQHFADANLQAIDTSAMTKRQIEQINRLIREGSEKSGPRPSFPGIEDKGSAYLHFSIDPELRKHFNDLMQKTSVTEKLNLPDGRIILHAITEPELRDKEILNTGFSQMRLRSAFDPENLEISAHPTYSHVIPHEEGSALARTKYLVPGELEFSDVLDYAKQNYRPRDMTRVFQTSTPRQIVDPQHIDEMKMYEELMKEYTGKKAGGAVHKAEGGDITADDLILEERKL